MGYKEQGDDLERTVSPTAYINSTGRCVAKALPQITKVYKAGRLRSSLGLLNTFLHGQDPGVQRMAGSLLPLPAPQPCPSSEYPKTVYVKPYVISLGIIKYKIPLSSRACLLLLDVVWIRLSA